MALALCPLLLKPRLMPKLWGGQGLRAWGKALPQGQAIGESWELYDDAAGSVQVAAGPAQGMDLGQLRAAWGEALLGPSLTARGGRFPLLLKLIDAQQDLSVQVHPDDALARALHGPQARGKNELWVVLEAAPGARLLSGFKPGTTAKDLETALAAAAVESLLQAVPVKAGDVVDVPAGRVHAIGAGCLVAEVQQNSDWTYRLWDYGRLEDGQPRALHLAEARQALRFDAELGCRSGQILPQPRTEAWGQWEALFEGPFFKVERFHLRAESVLPASGMPRLLMALQGELRLAWGAEAGMIVPRGATVLLPAALAARALPAATEAACLLIEPR